MRNIVRILMVSFFSFAALAEASAQTKAKTAPVLTGNLVEDAKNGFNGDPTKGVQLTGNVSKDAMAIWQKIIDASNTDLKYASALAGSANTNGSKIRKQCWDAIVALNEQANGTNLKDANGNQMARPDPHLFTDAETLAEIIDNLSPQGALFTSCSGAAELAKTNVLNFVSGAIAGAAGLAAMPVIPGL